MQRQRIEMEAARRVKALLEQPATRRIGRGKQMIQRLEAPATTSRASATAHNDTRSAPEQVISAASLEQRKNGLPETPLLLGSR
jgi:hypothetical protein